MPKRLVDAKQGPRKPHSIDAHVGNQLKARRTMAGMSQINLGRVAGITFQQVQKYERGANRIAAGHLYLFAQALECTPNDFFDGLRVNGKGVPSGETEEFLLTNDAIYLFKAFVTLKDHERAAVMHFAKSLAAANTRPSST
jgi:transcriptional regulator with XRE-family HTH domain